MTDKSQTARRWWRVCAVALTALALTAVIGGAAFVIWSGPTPEELLVDAKLKLSLGRYAQAEQLATQVPPESSGFARARLLAGEAATKLGRIKDAMQHYARIPDDGSKEAIIGLLATGELLLHTGDLTKAELCFRRTLDHEPDHKLAHERLAKILGITGRRWESVPHLIALIRLDVFTTEHLIHVGDIERMIELEDEHVEEQFKQHRDPGALLGIARVAISVARSQQAREMLEEVLEKQPHLIEAWARLGYIEAAASPDDFLRWNAKLPPEADDHPEIWAVRGTWAHDHDQPEIAIRCMWEAARRDANHAVAVHHLGRLLTQLGDSKRAAPFLARAEQLRETSNLANFIYVEGGSRAVLERISELTESLGRYWEAWGWCRVALANDPQLDWARERLQRVQPYLTPDLARTAPGNNPALTVDLSDFPLPNWGPPASDGAVEPVESAEASGIAFVDKAAQAGIDFRFFNDPDDPEIARVRAGARMYQFTGGGSGVLDFDGDFWPDLHVAQGCDWPQEENRGRHFDRIFRNLGYGRFADVTEKTGVAEDAFSQGSTVADIDCDGFPDLYVANVGLNRLYRNNGDGTFRDITHESGIAGEWWTTSCAIADLNADGLPDIFDTNFLAGEDVYELVCQGTDGKPRSCVPTAFPGAPDQIYLNLGDGRFSNVTSSAGIDLPDGNGLGVVAADFDGTGRLNLFVANDSVPNFYFVNETEPGGAIVFSEQAALLGLAVDRDGKAQACMGVAAGDPDNDGLVDLFVTNFFNEPNTFYHQRPGHLFNDTTHKVGLKEPSLQTLGFGAQFLDADLDGELDLVITNGHVDDFTHNDIPYRMPPQFFRSVGGAEFVQERSPALGPFFQSDWLGRGLTRLDWNRDGREDFVVSHLLEDPMVLMTNETVAAGKHLTLHLRGVSGARDAIGATVRVTAGDRTLVRQLTAGDGYMASNHRILVFGLGDRDRVDAVEIRWLGGAVQRFEDLEADSEWLAIEGRPALVPLDASRG